MPEENPKLSPLLQRALNAINTTTTGMTEEQMNWHPENKWDTAQILEHLALAFSGTVKGMTRVLREDKTPEVRRPTLREWVAAFLVVKLNYIPNGRQAPQHIVPKGIGAGEAMQAIRANLLEVDKIINDCEQRFGSTAKILVHPILGPLNVVGWRTFHANHTLHHMRQVENLRNQMKLRAVASNPR
jgi:uncharacterized protein DUF1569